MSERNYWLENTLLERQFVRRSRPIIWHPCIKAAHALYVCLDTPDINDRILVIGKPTLCLHQVKNSLFILTTPWFHPHEYLTVFWSHRNEQKWPCSILNFLDTRFVLSLYLPRGPLCAFVPPSFLSVIRCFSASHRPNRPMCPQSRETRRFYLPLICLSFCFLSPHLLFSSVALQVKEKKHLFNLFIKWQSVIYHLGMVVALVYFILNWCICC